MDPPFKLGVYPTIWANLPFLILSNNSGVGESQLKVSFLTGPCHGDIELDCPCIPDESAASS